MMSGGGTAGILFGEAESAILFGADKDRATKDRGAPLRRRPPTSRTAEQPPPNVLEWRPSSHLARGRATERLADDSTRETLVEL